MIVPNDKVSAYLVHILNAIGVTDKRALFFPYPCIFGKVEVNSLQGHGGVDEREVGDGQVIGRGVAGPQAFKVRLENV